MTYLEDEIFSQPASWATAIARAADAKLPTPGERVAVIGCGSSLNVSRAYARLREDAGHGVTDAYPASEVTGTRSYDHMVFISRTGTTSEVLAALREAPAGVATTSITAEPGAPLAQQTDNAVLLDFADERAVVSSQFISSALVLIRASLGADLSALPLAAAAELARPLPAQVTDRHEFTFLGAGWASFVADEAALKLREASQSWAESYPALEFRHGPISVSDPGTVIWGIGDIPASLVEDCARTGALVVARGGDPLIGLIGAQRLAVALAQGTGINPDYPRSLSRSVILALTHPTAGFLPPAARSRGSPGRGRPVPPGTTRPWTRGRRAGAGTGHRAASPGPAP
jgi:fructoselysine-6-P-deglycase FrlB-like protein